MPALPVLLTVLFVALKLIGVIAWSWLWVLSPLWISLALAVLIFLIVLAVGGTAAKRMHRSMKW